MEMRIYQTARDLRSRVEPRLVEPGHGTRWRATTRLANVFSPGRHAPGAVGITYRPSASAEQKTDDLPVMIAYFLEAVKFSNWRVVRI